MTTCTAIFNTIDSRYKIGRIKRSFLMKELQQDTIDQIRTHLFYLKQTDLMQNKDILMCLDIVAREYGGEVVDKN